MTTTVDQQTTEQYTLFLLSRSPDQWYALTLGSVQFLMQEVERAATPTGARAAAVTGLRVLDALNHVLHRHRIPTTTCPHGRPAGPDHAEARVFGADAGW